MQLAAAVSVPGALLAAAALTLCARRGRRCGRRKRRRRNVEEAVPERALVGAGKTLQDLICDVAASGSGSGRCSAPLHSEKETWSKRSNTKDAIIPNCVAQRARRAVASCWGVDEETRCRGQKVGVFPVAFSAFG